VSAIVPGAGVAAGVPAAVAPFLAGSVAVTGAVVAADSGSDPSRVNAHQIVPATASAPVAANRPTNVRADRVGGRVSLSSLNSREGGVKRGASN
jgi:hypothetical protein